jgi:anti-sigma regulatory factor (Ser/Thr protein kinase)
MAPAPTAPPVSRTRHPHFEHPALFYRDQLDYLAAMMQFVSNGINAGEPVMVAVPTRNLNLLRSAFGSAADAIEMHDMSVAGRNPGRIIGDVLLDFKSRHPHERVRIVGEPIWAGRDETEYPACAQHEALINAAFDGIDATILCPYNASELNPWVIDDARRTHPVLWAGSDQWESKDFDDPYVVADSFNVPMPPPPDSAATMIIYPENPHETRRFSASFALSVGLAIDRVADAVLAVDELVSNTITHAGGIGQLCAWTEGMRAVFEVSDSGFIADRLAGRRPARPDQTDGRGLALAHRQSDLVRIHTTPSGTAIRVYFDLD